MWGAVAGGMKPPVSTIRPALISRSASLCMACKSSGVGFPGDWGEVTIDMKRMKKLLLRRAAAIITAKLSRYWDRRTRPGQIDMHHGKISLTAPGERAGS